MKGFKQLNGPSNVGSKLPVGMFYTFDSLDDLCKPREIWNYSQSVVHVRVYNFEKPHPKVIMSLWVDKYRPTALSKLDFHKDQAANLRKLVQGGDFPHLLIYGPSGAGKKTRIMCTLRELYGSGVEKLRIEHQSFTVRIRGCIRIGGYGYG